MGHIRWREFGQWCSDGCRKSKKFGSLSFDADTKSVFSYALKIAQVFIEERTILVSMKGYNRSRTTTAHRAAVQSPEGWSRFVVPDLSTKGTLSDALTQTFAHVVHDSEVKSFLHFWSLINHHKRWFTRSEKEHAAVKEKAKAWLAADTTTRESMTCFAELCLDKEY